jgi:hypothetical protein
MSKDVTEQRSSSCMPSAPKIVGFGPTAFFKGVRHHRTPAQTIFLVHNDSDRDPSVNPDTILHLMKTTPKFRDASTQTDSYPITCR